MKCDNCGHSSLRASRTTKAFLIIGKPVVVENIPALVCDRCGDATFDANTAEQVRSLVHGPHPPARLVQAEVLQFNAA